MYVCIRCCILQKRGCLCVCLVGWLLGRETTNRLKSSLLNKIRRERRSAGRIYRSGSLREENSFLLRKKEKKRIGSLLSLGYYYVMDEKNVAKYNSDMSVRTYVRVLVYTIRAIWFPFRAMNESILSN